MSEKSEQQRLSVFKTYKLYVGGKFPRSESGRVYEVTDSKDNWLANVPLSSRKDARDAVVAARKAFGAWSGATAYNRGQILYRIAEMLEGRREQFVREVADAEGLSPAKAKSNTAKAAALVDAAIDRWVWYAGWTDKIAQVVGGGNPVAGPFFNLSSPEPTGVVAVLAPQKSSFLGLVSVLAPVIATGNTAIVIASERSPLPALSLGEVLATSDLPGGVVNVLSGRTAEIAAPLAAHQDVNAIDLAGADTDDGLAKELEIAAADNLKRVLRPQPVDDWTATPGIDRMTAFLETKTVWHPTGSLGASGSSY
ncbi:MULTISPECIES: aldehyde dehydrogenase family protein [unclassified Streptomyces]|uniref:aldehyde dehydrogenase family protein n=1 Tax=unclassified Streptomyces TaxID=2593676 RepID=UPI002256A8A3|nr:MULTISPECIES: aldehyde dehydrogenase family protein [unclassified Streptomyces]MCX5050639.1 aldehyde dehydrogenase family protein [Streptomyces sp. NBC_00474]MCX5061016.1 aldehyde dehydrogenase family protein [Streptomyces sp. NBC_00452]MCX5248546.1 aldehyde dehydrogenase family protein [Streptomyces sp. NBC_00201]MCX5293359.1 aldehyde dehydrogenase family protein [Streptomyces sp. NBC_00183]